MLMNMIQRQGTITHANTHSDPVLSRDHVIRDIRVKLCFSNIPVQEFDVPKSYRHPAHLSNEQFTFNFDLEKKVLEQAKNSLLSIEGEQSSNQAARQHPFLQNGVSTMLIPDRVDSASEATFAFVDNKALTQTVREFEGDNNDPFEMVQLQTIDDMAELQSVLQPNSKLMPGTTSHPTPYPPIATVAVTSHDAPLVDLSDSTTDHSEPPVNTDATRQRPQVPPRHHIPTHAVVTSHSTDITPPVPKPRVRSVSPQKEVTPKPVATTGVRVLPPLTSSSLNPSPPQLPSYSSVPVATTTKAPVLPSYEAAVYSQPAQPPPKPQAATVVSTDTYRLPDPTGSLSPKELEMASQIASMGFPKPRVARAAKRLKDSAKVLDFLVTIGDLEEQYHYNGDSIETALLASDDDPSKAAKYLEKVQSYKELGFSEKKIHAAYEKAKKDWDKTIDILVGDT